MPSIYSDWTLPDLINLAADEWLECAASELRDWSVSDLADELDYIGARAWIVYALRHDYDQFARLGDYMGGSDHAIHAD